MCRGAFYFSGIRTYKFMIETYAFNMVKYNDFDRLLRLVDSIATDESQIRVKIIGDKDYVSNVNVWSALVEFMVKHSTYWRVHSVEDNVVMRVLCSSTVHGPHTPVDHDVCVVLRAVGVEDI